MGSQFHFVVEAPGELLIIVMEHRSEFYAFYEMGSDAPQLMGRSPTNDPALIAGAFQAAVIKARELGWIV